MTRFLSFLFLLFMIVAARPAGADADSAAAPAGVPGTAPATGAAAPVLRFPLACDPGRECPVAHYADMDGAPGQAADPACGPRTYDAHEGTDFALRDAAAMARGVDVLAAAAGRVTNARDGAEDRVPDDAEIAAMMAARKGCGNGVLIDHGGGWQTIYCHLKQGSVAVKEGQDIAAGERIAQAGNSGAAPFPHLHFGLFHDGMTVDPFTGAKAGIKTGIRAGDTAGAAAEGTDSPGCGAGAAGSLWADKALRYEPFALYAAGFSGAVPDSAALRRAASGPETMAAGGLPRFIFWGAMLGARQGDRIRIEITAPDGRILAARDVTQAETRVRQFYFIGRPVGPEGLAPGVYTGRMTVVRPDAQDGSSPSGAQGAPSFIERRVTVTP